MSERPIVVLGAGPAGAATALGLARLGERVVVVGEPRRVAAVEGVSQRVIGALRSLGLDAAVASFEPPSSRQVSWNGVHSQANHEHLVDRQLFDQALLADLERLGIPVLRGRIAALRTTTTGPELCVRLEGQEQGIAARFLVEARGRAAPAAGRARQRGVETVSLGQFWQGPAGRVGAAVESAETGWAWMAALADGRRYLQFVIDAERTALPPRKALADFCAERFAGLTMGRHFLEGARPLAEPQARTSTAILNEILVGDDWLRVGDAAMAVDPLSGNGLFQSLSSALQAPAVIRTLLRAPERAALARDFHQQRVEQLFLRFARIGRDFYADESRWAQAPFWQARRRWPDAEPLHRKVTPSEVCVARRPVVQDDQIIEAEVVVTPDQPLGMWHLDGVPLAAALTVVREWGAARPAADSASQALAVRLDLSPQRAAALLHGMEQQGWVEQGG